MDRGINAREAALLALSACEQQGAWSDSFLKRVLREAEFDSRDASLCTCLCFGVLQNQIYLDFCLSQYSSIKLERLEEKVLQILRLGAYQMLCLDRIPQSAAVNESVKLARKYARHPRATGFVNGLLRTLARNQADLGRPEGLSVRYSHPEWLVQELSQAVPDGQIELLLRANNQQPPVMAQVNVRRVTQEQAVRSLLCQGVTVEQHPWLSNCLMITETGDLEQLEAFQNGWIYIQDPAARLAVLAADPRPGMQVLDACAAPGGKSFAAAIQMEDRGEILSCDIHPHKERLIAAGAERMGLSCIHTAVMDAKRRQEGLRDRFDIVFADVPCSGLGIIRKKPDIRYKDPNDLARLPQVQGAILENVADYVRPGGVLLYATCTVLDRENEGVIRSFLTHRKDFQREELQLLEPLGRAACGSITLWPHIHGTDGFFFAKLRRQ